MKKALWIIALIALIAGFGTTTLADEVEAPQPAVENAGAEALVPQDEAVEEISIEELLGISAMGEAQEKKMCWPTTTCTYSSECELNGQPSSCGGGMARVCDNPSGGGCAGTCVCDC